MKLCMFHPVEQPLERGLGRAHRRRARDPARRPDPPVVLHRGRHRSRARGLPARRGSAAGTGPPPALGARLRGSGVVRVREPGGNRPSWSRHRSPDAWTRRARAPAATCCGHRSRGRRWRLRRLRGLAATGGRAAEGPRLRARPRSGRRHAATSSTRAVPKPSSRANGAERLRGSFDGFDWAAARDLAAEGTMLFPGDLVVGPALGAVDATRGEALEIDVPSIGVLDATAGS